MPPFLFRLARPVLARVWVVLRGLTMGVRGIVLDDKDRVLLIRHNYTPGWHFPGGGVEIGETAEEALARELAEEANVVLKAPPVLHGIFHQPGFSRRDHVLAYVVRDFSWGGAHRPNREIADCAFFALDALPDDVSSGVRRRLAEVLDGRPVGKTW